MAWLDFSLFASVLGLFVMSPLKSKRQTRTNDKKTKKLWAIRPTEQWATLIFDSSHIYTWRIHFNELFFLFRFSFLFLNLFWDVSFIVTAHFKMMRIVKPDFMSCSVFFYSFVICQMNYAYGPECVSAHLFLFHLSAIVVGYLSFFSSESARLFRFLVNRSMSSHLYTDHLLRKLKY